MLGLSTFRLFQDSTVMRTVAARDEYQALFPVVFAPCREAVWHIPTRACTGTREGLLSATLTCWVTLEKLLLSMP